MTEPERDSPDLASNAAEIHVTTQLDESSPLSMPSTDVDLDAIERDLTGVEVALSRLADGTYRTDEVTGSALPDDVLIANPIARRA